MNPLDFLTPWQDMPDSFSPDPTSGAPSFGANTPPAAGDAGPLPVAQAAASPFPALGDPLAGTGPQDHASAPRAFLPWEGSELAPVEPVAAGTTGLDGIRQWDLNGFGGENPSGASFASAGFGPDPNVLAPAPAGAAQAGNPLDLALTPAWASPASPVSSIGGPGFQAPEAPKTWLLAHALNNAYGFAPPPSNTAALEEERPELAPAGPSTATAGLDGVRQHDLSGFGGLNPSGASFAAPGFGRAPAGAAQAGNPLALALTPAWTPPASPVSSIGGLGFQAPEAPKTWLLAHALNNAYGFAPPPAQTAFVKDDWSQPARVDPDTAMATGLDDIRQWDLNGFAGQTPSGASFAAPGFGRTSAGTAQTGNPLDLALTPAWAPPASPFPASGAPGFQAPEAPKTWLLAHALNNAYGFAPPPAMPQTPSARTGLVEGGGPEPARVGAGITGPDGGQQGQVNGFGRQSPSDVPWNGSGFRPAPNPLTPASASIVRIVPPQDSAITRAWTAPGAPFSPTGASGVQAPQTPKTWLLAHALNNAYGFAPTPAMPQTPPATWDSADDDTQDGSEQSAAPQDQGFMSQILERGARGVDQTIRNVEVAAIVAGQGFTPEGKDRLASIVMANDREARKAQARLDPEEQAIHEQLHAVGKSEGVVGTLKAIGNLAPTAVTNPKGLALGLAEQAANSAPTLIGSATGWATGLAVGGAAGTAFPVIGNATGGAVGSFLGARAGAAAGTAILEFGNEIQEYITNRLEKEEKPLTRENIIALLSDPAAQEAMVRQAALKGVTLAAVEAFFPGFSGRMAGSTKGMVRAGIKAGSDPAGGMVAEGTSSLIARGEVDKAAIAGEGIFGATHQAGHGMAHHAAGAVTHTASKASTSDPHTPPTAPGTPAAGSTGETNAAPQDGQTPGAPVVVSALRQDDPQTPAVPAAAIADTRPIDIFIVTDGVPTRVDASAATVPADQAGAPLQSPAEAPAAAPSQPAGQAAQAPTAPVPDAPAPIHGSPSPNRAERTTPASDAASEQSPAADHRPHDADPDSIAPEQAASHRDGVPHAEPDPAPVSAPSDQARRPDTRAPASDAPATEGAAGRPGETQSARSAPHASTGPRETSTGSRDGATQTASARPDARPAAGPRIVLGGLPIRIQTPRGAVRSGLNPDGTPWQQEQKSHHGVIEGTEHGSQGRIQVFVHPGAAQIADNARTFVVNHVDPATGRLTSPVVMLGFESPKQAQKAYQANFPRDRRKVGPIREIPASQLRDRVNALRQADKPAAATAAKTDPSGHAPRPVVSPNTGDARTGLRQGPLAPLVDRLIDTGQVVIHDTQATLPVKDSEGGRTQGMVDTDGTIHLVAENLNAKTALPVLLHEIFHSEVKRLLGDQRWQTLLQRLGDNYDAALRRARDGQPGNSRHEKFWDGAFRRLKDAGVSQQHVAEEFAAYAIENYAAAPAGVRSTVESLVGRAKAWVYQHSGVQMGAITPSQLVSLTQAALRASTQDRARTPSGNDAVRYSKAPKKPKKPRPPRDVESEEEIPVHLLSPADKNKVYYAASAADGVRLRNQLLALAIAGGHAFEKHVVGVDNPQGSEFVGLDIRNRAQFARHVENVINRPDRNKSLERNREHFYDRTTNTSVLKNPKDPDGGTAFRPKDGESYIDRLEENDGKNY